MKNNNKTFSFSSFSEQMANTILGLKPQIPPCNFLDEWTENAQKCPISESDEVLLNQLLTKMTIFSRGWNEEELKLKFIAPLLHAINFDDFNAEVAAFSERPLSVTVNDTVFSGIVDFIVATGIFEPIQPFFFIHEYKKEKENQSDPAGQLLVSMFVAQFLNGTPRPSSIFDTEVRTFATVPTYGIYVVGRFWWFVRLIKNQYFISNAYNSAEKEDLYFIFKMLKAQKKMIFDLVAEFKTN